ncbi:major capsid protein [Streptomyces rubiginosohelvolus]|uniref:major capsid protein n=1 Tax=Streptomyces rubiginosohelvolus TaxID=67362 RepID=UPI0033B02E60
MALTLAEAAKLSQDDLQRGVLETFVQESSVLDRIPFLTIQGNAYAYNEEATLPNVQFRSVNEGYDESTGTVNPKSESLVILGGDADVDRFIVQTRGNLNDQRATQTRMKVKAASYFFQDQFINGDTAVTPKGFDGLKKRLVGSQVISAGTNGIPIVGNGNSDAYAYFDALDALVASVPGLNGSNGALYTNRQVIAKTLSAGRRIGGVETVRSDITGKRQVTWNGIALLDIGQRPDGSDIMPMTETKGTATDAGSIYAVRFGSAEGDQAVTGLTNGGVQVMDLGQLQEKPVYRTRLEFYTGLALFGGKAAARLTGVLAK